MSSQLFDENFNSSNENDDDEDSLLLEHLLFIENLITLIFTGPKRCSGDGCQ